MATFHFHFRKGELVTFDEEGEAFANLDDARMEATAVAREILASAIRHQTDFPDGVIVADDHGQELAFVRLREVLPLALRKWM